MVGTTAIEKEGCSNTLVLLCFYLVRKHRPSLMTRLVPYNDDSNKNNPFFAMVLFYGELLQLWCT